MSELRLTHITTSNLLDTIKECSKEGFIVPASLVPAFLEAIDDIILEAEDTAANRGFEAGFTRCMRDNRDALKLAYNDGYNQGYEDGFNEAN